MKVGHILYKVKNIDKAVAHFRQEGFTVEYGTKKKPYNALIYFSEGPYLELMGNIKLPYIFNFLLKILGKEKIVERINSWHYAKEGLVGLCLENYKTDLEKEKKILHSYNQKFFEKNNKRLDTKGRHLKFKVLFPDEMKIPFLMTYFNIDPKPKNYTHPNEIKGISNISFGTNEEFIPLIKELCDDKILNLFVGNGIKDLKYDKKDGSKV